MEDCEALVVSLARYVVVDHPFCGRRYTNLCRLLVAILVVAMFWKVVDGFYSNGRLSPDIDRVVLRLLIAEDEEHQAYTEEDGRPSPNPAPTLRVGSVSSSNGSQECTAVHHQQVHAVRRPSLVNKEDISDRHLRDRLGDAPSKASEQIRSEQVTSVHHTGRPDSCDQAKRNGDEVDWATSKLQSERNKDDAANGQASAAETEATSEHSERYTQLCVERAPAYGSDVNVREDHEGVETDKTEVEGLV